MQILRLTLLLCGIACATAWTIPLTWTFSGVTFNDGGTASGSFVYDADTGTISNIKVTTTTGPVVPGTTYTTLWYSGSQGAGFSSSEPSLLSFSLASSMTNSGGTIQLAGNPLSPNVGIEEDYRCTPALCPGNAVYRYSSSGSISAPGITFSPCDVNQDGATNVIDAQRMVSEALGSMSPANDLNGDGVVDVVDIEIVTKAVLSSMCLASSDQPATAPAIAAVVNAADFRSGPIAPGEVVAVLGSGLGSGRVQVLFDGTPAPLIYATPNRIECVVPYEVSGGGRSEIQVRYRGRVSTPFRLNTAAANPALFTSDGSGSGWAAALNQDRTPNSPSNPAAKGSTVALFVTGEGQTSPPGMTGKVTSMSDRTPQPLLPVNVLVGGQVATVEFYGETPGVISGVMQVNVRIPSSVPSGELPVWVTIGGNGGQSGVTVSVKD